MINKFLSGFILFLCFSVTALSFSSCTHVRKAAEQGDADAQYDLALMYEKGEGLPQNYAEAFKWYRKAAEQGHTDAQIGLAHLYCKGKGIPQNYIEGYVWFSIASAKGDKDAKYNLSILELEMSSEQLAEAQYKAALMWETIRKKN